MDPGNPRTIYAATDDGVFKSTTSGGAWRRITAGLTGPAVRALVIDPTNPDVLYAGSRRSGQIPPSVKRVRVRFEGMGGLRTARAMNIR